MNLTMLCVKPASSINQTEVMQIYARPLGEVRIFEVTTDEGIYRILAKDELDAYKIFLEEYK